MNAICWLAGLKVPKYGVGSSTVRDDELQRKPSTPSRRRRAEGRLPRLARGARARRTR